MGLTVVTPAPSSALATLDQVKAELGVSDGSQDAPLADLIAQASATIVRYVRRPFGREQVKETLPGYGGLRLVLARYPIISITEVTINGSPILDHEIDDAEAGVLLRRSSWDSTYEPGWNFAQWTRRPGYLPDIAVTYWAGYRLPADSDPGDGAQTLPADVRRACVRTVVEWHRTKATAASQQVTRQRVGDIEVSFGAGSQVATSVERPLPVDALQLLASAVRVI